MSDRHVIPADRGQLIELMCITMHDAYEEAAAGAGWETNPASRKPWAGVPEANKVTMRAAVGALVDVWVSPAVAEAERRGAERALTEAGYASEETFRLTREFGFEVRRFLERQASQYRAGDDQ